MTRATGSEVTALYGTGASEASRRAAFTSGAVPVAVYGLGKMGLPLATVFADVTGNVVGVDVDPERVRTIGRGECPFEHEPGLDAAVRRVVEDASLVTTTDGAGAAADARLHVLIVPTSVEANVPVLDALEAAAADVARGLAPGDVVVLESTVPPGTLEEVVVPLLAERSGVDPDDFGAAVCPERTASGRALRDIRGAHPRVVGGVDDESTDVAWLVYDELTDAEVHRVSDATTAECVKVFEGVYRDVNIALANELARLRDDVGVDVVEAIDAANTLAYCDIHAPGVGVGGHCIPYYPYFLIDRASDGAPLMRAARGVNDGMPAFATEHLSDLLARRGVAIADATVLVLGLTYRPGIPETRESPAGPLVDGLVDRGASVIAADPVLGSADGFDATYVPLDQLGAHSPDGAVLVTAHEAFREVDWARFDPMAVVDGRASGLFDGTDHLVYTIGSGYDVR